MLNKKSYAFVGTSYLLACEPDYQSTIFNNNSNYRFVDQTNIVQAISKKNPDNTIYNCSESGVGIETYYKKILTLLDRYNPDNFVIEIPQGERILAHTSNKYAENYDLYFPVQIWEDGLPQNKDEPFRSGKESIPTIDSFQTLMNLDDINDYWTKHTDMIFNFSEQMWRSYKQILVNLNSGRKSKYSDVIAQCEIINEFLISKGKKVTWFHWEPPTGNVNEISSKMNLLKDVFTWKYIKDFGERTTFNEKHKNLHTKSKIHFQEFCYDNTHLKSKYMPEFAEYFNEVFNYD